MLFRSLNIAPAEALNLDDCKTTGVETDGMENFPSDGNGGFLPYILSATEKDEDGNPKRIWANLQIVYFVPRA